MKSRRTHRAASPETSSDFSKFFGSLLTQGDLSRFGRNYIEVGKYIERVLPFMGVRFISINDNYDSEGKKNDSDSLMLPFKNLVNDAYCRDISVKIRSQLDIKRKKGECISALRSMDTRNHRRTKTGLWWIHMLLRLCRQSSG